MKVITVPAGIGDNVWLLQKLINQPQKLSFVLPGGLPQRGKQIFDLLPQVVRHCEYSKDRRITYNFLAAKNIQKAVPLWSNIKYTHFALSANEHLEHGKRLEEFLPDLATSFTIDWQTSHYEQDVKHDTRNYHTMIGIYGSSYSTTRAWGFWQENEWLDLILKMHEVNKNITYVLIGADWDLDLGVKLINRLKSNNIECFDTVGKPLAYVIEVMKRLKYAFYFPSGLPILSETLTRKTDCLMFYPDHLKKMIGSWRNPSRGIEFKEMPFTSPDKVFDFVKNDYKLFERIA